MLMLRRGEHLSARFLGKCQRYFTTQSQPASEESEYVEVPQYPKIKDVSFKAKKTEQETLWFEEISRVPTVEEKLIKINMPRYYGFKVIQLSDGKIPYNSLPAMQHYTRTVFTETKSLQLPAEQLSSQQLDTFVNAIKQEIQDSLEFAHDFFSQKYSDTADVGPIERETNFTQIIVDQINRTLINALSADCSHLQEVEIDYNPRHEAFWLVGGIHPPKSIVKKKKGNSWQKDMAEDPINRNMQYIGSPYLTVRHRNQLPPWGSAIETENLELAKSIPRFNYDPATLGYSSTHQHGTNIPGFWPGSNSGFGCISYQPRIFAHTRPKSFGLEDFKEALHMQAIQSSYSWLLAQANYNGFNTVTELTYPMNTQTIITNGRDWSFYEYQLNTLLVHNQFIDSNPIVNLCRGTGEMQLYQEIDKNGKCVGLNDEVLRHLIQFYANTTNVKRSDAELQPFLSENLKRIADYPNDDQREWLERTFKHLVSNRSRHLELPEIYLWEKLYKIDNKTQPMDPKRRFFEVHINPWKRTLDQHDKEYIPRSLRPEGPKSKKKFKPTYYP